MPGKYSLRTVTLLLVCFALHAIHAADAGKGDDYSKLITQHYAKDGPPDPKLFSAWLLDEINNDSLMRSQIAQDVADIEANGHNTNSVTSYYTPDKEYAAHLYFKESDLTIKGTGKGKDGVYEYQATLKATDGFHGGYSVISFHFSFKARTEYFKYTKAYMIAVVSYPKFAGKDTKEFDFRRQ